MEHIKDKVDDIITASKVAELLRKKDGQKKLTQSKWFIALMIVLAVAVIAVAAYAIYRYMTPAYIDDFDDDFDEDFEDEEAEDPGIHAEAEGV